MSLDKAIEHGKEHRKQYKRACRNHSSCEYCNLNRLYQIRKEKEKALSKLKEDVQNEV